MKKLFALIMLILLTVLALSSNRQPEYTGYLLIEVNQYRNDNGLAGLIGSPTLDMVAEVKCNDMVERGYFSHETPDNTFVWDMFMFDYNTAGENLASGYTSAEATVKAWSVSPLHNDNLLNTNYSQVGHGVCWDKSEYKIVQVLKG